jgi:hypothetical protein
MAGGTSARRSTRTKGELRAGYTLCKSPFRCASFFTLGLALQYNKAKINGRLQRWPIASDGPARLGQGRGPAGSSSVYRRLRSNLPASEGAEPGLARPQAPMIVAPARATAGKAGVSDIPRACEECLPRLRWTCHKRPESLAKSARPDRTVARRRLEPEGHWVKRVTAAALTRRPRAPETVRLYANDWTAFVTW